MYRYFGDDKPLDRVINDVRHLPGGGTLAVMLALHALRNGYRAKIYTCNLQLFDPSWFQPDGPDIRERLKLQMEAKPRFRLRTATRAYLDFLDQGGELFMEDPNADLLGTLLQLHGPLIVGLSATWLYRCPRERQDDMVDDDVRGEPTGHFLIVYGLDRETRQVYVADPYVNFPHPGKHHYTVHVDRFIAALLLGIVTDDAKILALTPPAR